MALFLPAIWTHRLYKERQRLYYWVFHSVYEEQKILPRKQINNKNRELEGFLARHLVKEKRKLSGQIHEFSDQLVWELQALSPDIRQGLKPGNNSVLLTDVMTATNTVRNFFHNFAKTPFPRLMTKEMQKPHCSLRYCYSKNLHRISYPAGRAQLPVYAVQDGNFYAMQWQTFYYSTTVPGELQRTSLPLQFTIIPESE